jgi:hypothetical protein
MKMAQRFTPRWVICLGTPGSSRRAWRGMFDPSMRMERAWPRIQFPLSVRVAKHYTELGTDGYGRSDTRANLRRHFEVDRFHVAQAATAGLAADDKMTEKNVSRRSSFTRSMRRKRIRCTREA